MFTIPQVDREDADITDWDSGCPDMSEHNSRDCAALISITAKVRSMCSSLIHLHLQGAGCPIQGPALHAARRGDSGSIIIGTVTTVACF